MNQRAREVARLRVIGKVADQRRWIEDHGGDRLGYVARYGSMNDERRIGDGGELIYEADLARLREFEDRLLALKD